MLVVEEGYPDYIEQAINVELRRADMQTRVYGKDVLPKAGEYTSDVLLNGLAQFLDEATPGHGSMPTRAIAQQAPRDRARRRRRQPPRSARCRRGRRPSAPAARSGRCSPRSS